MAGRQSKQDTDALFAQALSLQSAGRGDAAREAYSAVLALEPEHANALNNLGILHNSAGQHEDALALFERLVQATPAMRAPMPTAAWRSKRCRNGKPPNRPTTRP